MKRCPFCAEEIQDEAVVCRFCGKDIVSDDARQLAAKWGGMSEKQRNDVWATLPDQKKREVRAALGQKPQVAADVMAGAVKGKTKKKTSPAAWGCLFLILFVLFISVVGQLSRKGAQRGSSSPRAENVQPSMARFIYAKSAANVRSGPSTDEAVVRKTAAGERMQFIEKDGDWYRLKTPGGHSVEWIHSSVIMTADQYAAAHPQPQGGRSGATSVYGQGDSVHVGYTTYAVWRSWWSDNLSHNRYLDERPNAKFLFVELTVRNDDKKARRVPPLSLVDDHGAEYDSDSRGWRVEGSIDILDNLNPDVSKQGFVVFDVPKDRNYRLKVDGGYWSSEDAYIALKPKESQFAK